MIQHEFIAIDEGPTDGEANPVGTGCFVGGGCRGGGTGVGGNREG